MHTMQSNFSLALVVLAYMKKIMEQSRLLLAAKAFICEDESQLVRECFCQLYNSISVVSEINVAKNKHSKCGSLKACR